MSGRRSNLNAEYVRQKQNEPGYYDDPSAYKGSTGTTAANTASQSSVGTKTAYSPSVSSGTAKTTTTTQKTTAGDYSAYNRAIRALRDAQDEALAAKRQATDAAVAKLEGQRGGIRRSAEAAVRQAYINRMLDRKNSMQMLSAAGYTGGLTDSANLRMQAAYEQNRGKILGQMNSSLSDIDAEIANVRAKGLSTASDVAAKYESQLSDIYAQMAEQQKTSSVISSSEEHYPKTAAAKRSSDSADDGSVRTLSAAQALREASAASDPITALLAMLRAGQIDQETYTNLRYSLMNPGR